MKAIKPHAKAIVGFITGGLAVLYTALADGSVSPQEWVGVALGAFGVPATVWAVPNKNP